jgi:hypothetical protein
MGFCLKQWCFLKDVESPSASEGLFNQKLVVFAAPYAPPTLRCRIVTKEVTNDHADMI